MNFSRVFLTSFILAPFALTASDNFADATAIDLLDAQLTRVVAGTTDGATAEVGEPDHAGVTASASFWYAFTVESPRRVEILGDPSTDNGNVVMAVYTGSTLANLEVVERYQDLEISRPASSRSLGETGEPFIDRARLNFDAVPGTTYFIAVDEENNSTGSFSLTFSTSRDPLAPILEVVPAGANWSFYHALDGTSAFDPSIADTDFYDTWHTAADYDGPAFSEPSPTPLSYGGLSGEPSPATTLSPSPASGQRTAVIYNRTTFTPTRGIQALGFEGAFDDGAIIYINGIEVTRLNINNANPVFNTPALSASFAASGGTLLTERFIQYGTVSGLDLRAGVPVEIAISIHNSGVSSSDSGFNMRVYATETDPNILVIDAELLPNPASNAFTLSWQAFANITYVVEEKVGTLNAETWVPASPEITPITNRTLNVPVVIDAQKAFFRVRNIDPAE